MSKMRGEFDKKRIVRLKSQNLIAWLRDENVRVLRVFDGLFFVPCKKLQKFQKSFK